MLTRQRTRKRPERSVEQRYRPLACELLEPRDLLAALSFINPNGGFWGVASNWNLGRVPANGDDVIIPQLANNAAVSFDLFAPSTTLASLTTEAPLTVSNTLALTGDVKGHSAIT